MAALLATAAALVTAAAQQPPNATPAATLPVTRVVLFTSGVGYFERSGTVTGTQDLTLSVAADQMDDLLQSLVVQDLGGGSVRPVRYPSQDPLARILQGYRLDLSTDPTLAGLLSQARGEAVQLDAGQAVSGTIVDVERVEVAGKAPLTYLTLDTEDGLRRLPLDEVTAVRFADPKLQADLQAALRAIAARHGNDDRTVTLRFAGQGARRVTVGYVRAMPVWKTSYRLVLKQGTADLQGWAIVDNPTDTDLRDVRMTFVAGQPISFVTALYDPIYVNRPHVSLDLGPSIAPPAAAGEVTPSAKSATRALAAPSAADAANGLAGAAAQSAAPQLSGAGVQAMAQGTQTGSSFSYRVDQPVTVLRHESAMIPIVLSTVPATPLSVYDASVLPGHPLRAVRLVNDSGSHLAAGPVTIYDEGGFAGDARIEDIVPGDARVLSYAVDLGTSVMVTSGGEPERVSAVTVKRGTLEITSKQRLRASYRISVRDGAARFLAIDVPKRSGYQLVSPSPAPAQTPTSYRFGVAIRAHDGSPPSADAAVPTQRSCRAGDTCTLEVVMERTLSRSVAVSNVSSSDIAFYLTNVELSASDRATLGKVLDLKRRIAELDRQLSNLQAQVNAIFQDQSRIRQNMSALDRTSSLYKRYADDLAAQETKLQSLRSDIDSSTGKKEALQSQLDQLIASLGSG